MEMSELRYETTIPETVEALWKEWTDQTKITKWFSPEANIEPRLDGAYELFFNPSDHDSMSTKGCRITEFEPRSQLMFQWKGPDQYAQLMNAPPETHVEVTFSPKGPDTVMTITHTGWGQGSEWQGAREWHDRAWQGVIADLKEHLAQRLP
jgi:uncharacterized protein YndB with AHSA1/START domain